jgi:hypothetical protein
MSRCIDSLQFASDLGLLEPDVGGQPRLDAVLMEEMASGRQRLAWAHLGQSRLPIATLEARIRGSGHLQVPRTGHLGDWTPVALGQAFALDYNKIICQQESLGFPHIFDLNQTENAARTEGDSIYLPGSVFRDGRMEELDLQTWNGREFGRADRKRSLLCAFATTMYSLRRVTLPQLHAQTMSRLPLTGFKFESQTLLENEAMLRRFVREVWSQDSKTAAAAMFGLCFDKSCSVSGSVAKIDWRADGSNVQAGEWTFSSYDQILEAILRPLRAAADPQSFLEDPRAYDAPMLLCSASFTPLMLATCGTHLRRDAAGERPIETPFRLHLHWGAIGMAGYPPNKRGYFDSNMRYMRKIAPWLSRASEAASPLFFTLLPASIYMLWPRAHDSADGRAVTLLVEEIMERTAGMHHQADLMQSVVVNVAASWLAKHRTVLSPYFQSRFTKSRSIFHSQPDPIESTMARPAGFSELSLAQASMTVGALFSAFSDAS